MQLAFAGGPTIEVDGANAGVETWLREYFGGALTAGSAAPPSARIVVVQSAEERRRLRATRSGDARRRPVFAVEREMLEQDGWTHDGALVIDYDARDYVVVLEDRLPRRLLRRRCSTRSAARW
jgi:hypothetical protein